jgi:hypothetical protein
MHWLSKPIETPAKFKRIGLTTTPFYPILTKIFLIDEIGVKKWDNELPQKKLKYVELLSYIEEIRVKDFHKMLTGNRDEHIALEKFTHNMPVLHYKKYRNWETYLCGEVYKLLIDCNRRLRENRIFPKLILEKVNRNRNLILGKCLVSQSKKKKHSIFDDFLLEEDCIDAFDDFVFTLIDDLFRDMGECGRFKICKYKKCGKIFQRKTFSKYETQWQARKYCNKVCLKRASD